QKPLPQQGEKGLASQRLNCRLPKRRLARLDPATNARLTGSYAWSFTSSLWRCRFRVKKAGTCSCGAPWCSPSERGCMEGAWSEHETSTHGTPGTHDTR